MNQTLIGSKSLPVKHVEKFPESIYLLNGGAAVSTIAKSTGTARFRITFAQLHDTTHRARRQRLQ
jgi:hypothetical protein